MPRFLPALASVLSDVGKLPVLRSLGITQADAPISLFNSEQFRKFRSYLQSNPAEKIGFNNQFMQNYWQGRRVTSLGPEGRPIWGGVNRAESLSRKGVAFGLGGLVASNLLGLDPMGMTSAGNEALRFGFHGIAGMTMYRMGGPARLAGLAYLGIGGLNMMRRGDNMGPF